MPATYVLAALGIAVAGFGHAASTESLDVCLKPEVRIGSETLRRTQWALKSYEKDLRVSLNFPGSCVGKRSIFITLRAAPTAGQLTDALGATRVQAGRVLPEIEVFCESVRRMLP